MRLVRAVMAVAGTGAGDAGIGGGLRPRFRDTVALTGYDNVTFGSDTPIVPEPTTLSLLALAGAGLAARRRVL